MVGDDSDDDDDYGDDDDDVDGDGDLEDQRGWRSAGIWGET